ncbi:MAG: ferrous iron transport protein B [Gemmataceae bacterium]
MTAAIPTAPAASVPAAPAVVALLGNPNTGKTTLFNALSGLNHRTGNYAGVTVESKKGSATFGTTPVTLVDLPGTYSLAPRSPDEMVAVDVLLGLQAGEPRPDLLVCIVDASNLERNLYLTTQALELGLPVVVALNMVDLAASHGLTIDVPTLSRRLGVPVVPIQANQRKGLDELRRVIVAQLSQAAPSEHPRFPEAFEAEVRQLRDLLPQTPDYLLRRLILDVGGQTEKRLAIAPEMLDALRGRLAQSGCPIPAIEARTRYGWIRDALKDVVTRPAQRPVTWTDRIDAVLTHRLWGTLVFLLVMFLIFQSIFVGAKYLMDPIDEAKNGLAETVKASLPSGPFTRLLADGMIAGVGAVVVFLPQILILFAFLAILEDCGYMARAAFLMDRLMARAGLSGKSFIPLLSSLACAIPGIMATRVIENFRDRLATILVAPLMSCSARIPVYTLLIGAFLTEGYPWWFPGLVMFLLYLIGLVVAPLVAWVLKATLLRGPRPVFVMEMPAYKWPDAWVVLRRMVDSGWAFLARAGSVILATSIVIWALLNFPEGTYPEQIDELNARIAEPKEQAESLQEQLQLAENAEQPTADLRAKLQQLREQIQPVEAQINALLAEWRQHSYLGQFGRAVQPAFAPLGWDWRITVAAIASFPAREVIVGTLGILYQQGETDAGDDSAVSRLGEEIRGSGLGLAAALSLLIFFVLCCQCASTLAVIYRETRSWFWPVFTFVYMTALAYLAALATFWIACALGA